MEYLVRGQFTKSEDAQRAFDQLLQLGFRMEQLAFRSRFASDAELEESQAPSAQRDIGAALLTERIMSSLSTTGFNLTGNSTLAGTRLGDIGRLLSDVADEDQHPPVRIDVLINSLDATTAQTATAVLEASGARHVRRKVASTK